MINRNLRLVIFIYCINILGNGVESKTDCLPKSFGKNKIVCVCNSQHCDTIDPISTFTDGKYLKYTSSKSGLRFEKIEEAFQTINSRENTIAIDLVSDEKYQQILGWGGAFTDAFGINMKFLSEDVQDQLMRSYFSEIGLEYTIARVPIAGTDFSTKPYEYDEVSDDKELKYFNLTEEDYVYKIPYIQKAIDLKQGKELKFVATAWSAPPWMKTSDAYTGLGFLKEELYQTWADYHIKFLDHYSANNISFWALTTGNEPVNGLLPIQNFNAMGWTPTSVSKWISENLNPSLKKSKYSNTKIIGLDDQRFFLPWWIDLMFENSETKSAVDGIGVHWYQDWISPIGLLDLTNKRYPNKFLLYTEACIGDKPWEKKVDIGSWNRGEMYLKSIIETGNHHVSGWMDWNLALNEMGGPNWAKNYVDSPIIINTTANEFYKQPMFYALGHVSKFVPPDSVRIGNSAKLPYSFHIYTLLRPDQHFVVILLNGRNKQYNVTIKHPTEENKYVKTLIEQQSFNTIII